MGSQSEGVVDLSEVESYYKLDNILLSSCQILQANFKGKWKRLTGKVWINDKEHGEKLTSLLNKQAKKLCQRGGGVKKMFLRKFSTGNVEDWDFETVLMALLNVKEEDVEAVGAAPSPGGAAATIEVHSQLNEAVQNLIDLRNFLDNHATKKVSKEEYSSNLDKFDKAMKTLKVTEPEIKGIIEGAGLSSSVAAMGKVEELYKKAAKLLRGKKFEKAMECYTEASGVPSLLPIQLASVYEMRAQAYLKVSDGNKELVQKAFEEVQKALKLNQSSWNGHQVAGQCNQKLENFAKAVESFKKVLLICPGRKHIQKELEECKVQAELLGQNNEDECGVDDIENCVDEGTVHVLTGHRYFRGVDVEQNYETAVSYYDTAAKCGNTEGIYNMGMCYQLGKGVERNYEIARSYFLEAANLSPGTTGRQNRRKKNFAVAACEHSVGLCFEEGIGIPKDFQVAVKWYQKAMENGSGNAANNLGSMYYLGRGIPKNDRMAAICWKEGVFLMEGNSALPLINYYLREKEPNLALGVFETLKQRRPESYSEANRREFEKQCKIIWKIRLSETPEVEEYERGNKLETKGITFEERRYRMILAKQQVTQNIPEFLKHVLENREESGVNCNRKQRLFNLNSFSEEGENGNVEEIIKRAERGSGMAQRVLQLWVYCRRLLQIVLPTAPFYKEEEASEIMELLYNCVTLRFGDGELIVNEEELLKVRQVVKNLFERKAGEEGEDDKKIRLVYAVINVMGQDDNFATELLQEGSLRYKDCPFYLFYLAKIYEDGNQNAAALGALRDGLNLVPNDIHFIFAMANMSWKLNKDNSNVFSVGNEENIRAAFQRYLEAVGEDELNIVEACFAICYCILKQLINLVPMTNEIIGKIEEAYRIGVAAEGKQLPCFERKTSKDKESVDQFFRAIYGGAEDDKDVSVFEKKVYLRAPKRKQFILTFRKRILENKFGEILEGKSLEQGLARRAALLKPITLLEMNQSSAKVYQDRILDLTIIENPIVREVSIQMLAEDENGDVTVLFVYDDGKDRKEVEDKLGFGCKVAVINPILGFGQDMIMGIRNDEPWCMVYLGRIADMCRLCGEKAATFRCGKCLVANYCCKECQQFDWKEFGHKIICATMAQRRKK